MYIKYYGLTDFPAGLWPAFLCDRKLRCNVVVIDKNCEAILARAPALAVRFLWYRELCSLDV